MFIGHYGIAFGAKRPAHQTVSLGILFLAAQWLDLLWPTLLLFGVEDVAIEPGVTKMSPLHFTHYPYSHSLLMTVAWSVLLGLLYYAFRKSKRGAIIVGLCVFSHWVLDWFMHQPDLPLYPGAAPKYGLGLWNSLIGTHLIELTFFLTGVFVYAKNTTAKNKAGVYAFWSLVFFLLAVYVMNSFGPPPPNANAIAWAGELQWLFVIWAFWIDRNRTIRGKDKKEPAYAATPSVSG